MNKKDDTAKEVTVNRIGKPTLSNTMFDVRNHTLSAEAYGRDTTDKNCIMKTTNLTDLMIQSSDDVCATNDSMVRRFDDSMMQCYVGRMLRDTRRGDEATIRGFDDSMMRSYIERMRIQGNDATHDFLVRGKKGRIVRAIRFIRAASALKFLKKNGAMKALT